MTEKKSLPEDRHASRLWVKDIKIDGRVSGIYVAKMKRLAVTKKGDPFLSLTLYDRTGDIEARVWDRAEEFSSIFVVGDILDVEGHASSFRDQVQVTLSSLRVSEESVDPTLFLEATPRNVNKMMTALKQMAKEIKNPHLKKLIDRFFADRRFISQFRKAPAAKGFHHNYIGGLLEHTLSVCEMISSVTEHYPELDRDLLWTGGFLHDIGKTRELKFDVIIDYTDEGRLLGHLALGVAMIDEMLSGMKDFPQDLSMLLKHLILSHHGEYEFGSPKRPKFLEAFALHLIDDLDAKINGLGRFMEKDQQAGSWTDFNRLFDRYFFKGEIPGISGSGSRPHPEDRQEMLFRED
jgi:3'-5' exoribonuclease